MRQALRPHLATPCPAISRLEAVAEREGARLRLSWRLAGDLDALAIPPSRPAARTHGLWEHTCFEAFVSFGGESYLEFNLSPSGEWAAYRFDAYRAGMAPLETAAPEIEVSRTDGALELRAVLDLLESGPIRLGLTAVIEAADGALSYWALAHPPGRPDFHHADGRVLAV